MTLVVPVLLWLYGPQKYLKTLVVPLFFFLLGISERNSVVHGLIVRLKGYVKLGYAEG